MMLLIPRLLVTASVLLAVTDGWREPIRSPHPEPRDIGRHDYYSSPGETWRTTDYSSTGIHYREQIHPPSDRSRDTNQDSSAHALNYQVSSIMGNSRTRDDDSVFLSRHEDDGMSWFNDLFKFPIKPKEQEIMAFATDEAVHSKPPSQSNFYDELSRQLSAILHEDDIPLQNESQNLSELVNSWTRDDDSVVSWIRDLLTFPIEQKDRHDDDDKASLALLTSLALRQSESHSQKFLFDRMLFKIIDSLGTLTNEIIAVHKLLKGEIPREDESQNPSELIQNCTRHVEQIQKQMLTFKDHRKNVLESIDEFEQAYEILRESWKTKLENILSRAYSLEARIFLEKIENVRPLRDTRGPLENIKEKTRTADKLQDSSKPATTLSQALAQLYNIQDHVKLEVTNCTHQIDHFLKQMRLFEDQQIKVYDSITKLKHEYKLLRKSWKTELQKRNVSIETVYHKLYKDIQLLRSTDHEQEIIMEDTLKLNELQVSSELAMPLVKLRKRLIFLTDPFKWEHSIWHFESNESRRSPDSKWLYFKQIDPQLKRWRLVATGPVRNFSLEKDHGVEPTDSGSPIMEYSTWTFLGKFWWNDTNCDLEQCGWLVFNQTDPSLKRSRLVVSSPIRIEGQQNSSKPHTTLDKSHSYVGTAVPSKIASGLPRSLEDETTTTIDPLLVDELQDPMNPIKLGLGRGNLVLSKPVKYEDMFTWNLPDRTSSVLQLKIASGLPRSLEDETTTTIDPLLVDELQDPMNPIKLGLGRGNLVLSKPVKYEDMFTWNLPDQTSSVP